MGTKTKSFGAICVNATEFRTLNQFYQFDEFQSEVANILMVNKKKLF